MSSIPTIAQMDVLPIEEVICYERWIAVGLDGEKVRGAWYLLALTPAGQAINPPAGAFGRLRHDTAWVWVESPLGAWADEMGSMDWEAKEDYARDFGIWKIEKDESFTPCRLIDVQSYKCR